MRGRRGRIGRLFLASTLILAAGRAEAGPSFRTAGELPELGGTERVRWRDDRIQLELNSDGAPRLSLASVEGGVREAMRAWSSVSCGALAFDLTRLTSRRAEPDDGHNTIEWVRTGWALRGYDPAAAGATDILYERSQGGDWVIAEADIYLNAEHHSWVVEGRLVSDSRSVISVLAHELGHALGLLHPCEVDGAGGAPICESGSALEETTMHPIYAHSQATLSGGDAEGLCFLYPRDDCEGEACTVTGKYPRAACAGLCGNLNDGAGEAYANRADRKSTYSLQLFSCPERCQKRKVNIR